MPWIGRDPRPWRKGKESPPPFECDTSKAFTTEIIPSEWNRYRDEDIVSDVRYLFPFLIQFARQGGAFHDRRKSHPFRVDQTFSSAKGSNEVRANRFDEEKRRIDSQLGPSGSFPSEAEPA